MKINNQIKTGYLEPIFNVKRFSALVEQTIVVATDLRDKYKFDTIAFSGVSGSAMAYILSYTLKLPLICVRKAGEPSHYPNEGFKTLDPGDYFEGNLDVKKYLIVDDRICSGATVNRIRSSIEDRVPTAKCSAILLYCRVAESINIPLSELSGDYWNFKKEILKDKKFSNTPVYGVVTDYSFFYNIL